MPTLQGDGVRLRPFRDDDVEMVMAASLDPLIPLIGTLAADAGLEAARAWIERQRGRSRDGDGWSFAVADLDTDRAMGQIGLFTRTVGPGRASIGYWLESAHRRRGVITASLRVLSDWALDELRLDRLELYVEPWNEGSWRAAERAGFRREGLLRAWQTVGDTRRDMYMYSRLPGDGPVMGSRRTDESGPRRR